MYPSAACGGARGMAAHDETGMQTETTTTQDEALVAFWTRHRLAHRADALREFLGTEALEDLDCVEPGDLRTMHALRWAEAHLSLAEAGRLRRAVEEHHARAAATLANAAGFAAAGAPAEGAEHRPFAHGDEYARAQGI